MKIGRFTVEQLSEGQFEFFPDGTINRQPVDKETDNISELISKNSSELIGINPVYVTDGDYHILLETGLGWGLDDGSVYEDVSNVVTNLEIFGIHPEDITHVILSHLHYDHSAGSSFTRNAKTVPTFPKARYIIQQSEWDFALSQQESNKEQAISYRPDDLYRLYADSYFEMIDGKEEIIPGITVISTGGHTKGHQVVKITDQEDTGYFLGDLIATEKQLNNNSVGTHHINRTQTKKWKIQLLKRAYQENAVLLLYHSLFASAGRLVKNKDEQYVLKEQ